MNSVRDVALIVLCAVVLAACSSKTIGDGQNGDEQANPPMPIVREPSVEVMTHHERGTVTRTRPAQQYMVSGLWRWSSADEEWQCTARSCDPRTKPAYRAVKNQQIKEKDDG